MKTLLILIFAITIQGLVSIANVCAQTVAIGHVSAEIVEAVSVSSLAVTGFEMNNENNLTASAQTDWNYENVNLGSIKINSGKDVACNVVMKSAELSDSNGNGFSIEPIAINSTQADTQRTDGNQTLQVNGRARIAQGQASGLYQGSYTMVFAYN